MYSLNEDKIMCSNLVRSFPKEMIMQVKDVLDGLSNYDINGLWVAKISENNYRMCFELEELYKLIFAYKQEKKLSLEFIDFNKDKILSVNSIDSEEKRKLINEVITQTIFKDKLIDSNHKRK